MRGITALYVVCHHISTYLWLPEAPRGPGFFNFGHLAVDAFIVLSGFSLMLPVTVTGQLRGGARGFYLRRAMRILPPYLFALALSCVLALTLVSATTLTIWDSSLPVTWRAVLAHLTLTQDLFHDFKHKIDYPLWSVSVESHVYLLFPLIVAGFSKYRGWCVALACVAFGSALQLLIARTTVDATETGAMPMFIGLFGLGCFLLSSACKAEID